MHVEKCISILTLTTPKIESAHQDLTYWLLEKGADVDVRDQKSYSPIHTAITNEDDRMTGALVRATPISRATDMNGDNALHLAIKQESDIMVEERLRFEFNHELRNIDRDTALHVCSIPRLCLGSPPASSMGRKLQHRGQGV
ncbi:predicted protein [Coccidioides posadasii str. Silveira]|uniref:Predicted protein n=2 Tax=Coccidioides posadasii TaxID=199306 RepID=E9DCT1_COCPS|nr:predicted protein [Coccidioides posadasii str. Silveira]KMM69316.1 hypothetical protein CPAG_05634 [Coccidioides posadasii RMSCC 3488]